MWQHHEISYHYWHLTDQNMKAGAEIKYFYARYLKTSKPMRAPNS